MHYASSSQSRARALAVLSVLVFCAAASRAADIFNLSNRQLSIPSIVIGTATYTNMVVGVALPQVSGPSGIVPDYLQDYFDPTTSQLLVSSVYLGGKPYYNVRVNLTGLVSLGGVSGAASYDGTNVTLPAVQIIGGPLYTNVVAAVSAADIVSVSSGLPKVAQNQYNTASQQLTLPVVTYAGRFFTNVVVRVTLSQVRSVGTRELTDSVPYSFLGKAGSDGAQPGGSLIQGSDGSFYGTTASGGTNNLGAVFRISPTGSESLLYSFGSGSGTDGASPYSGVVLGGDGNFYGTTAAGGTYGRGTFFRVTPGGAETVLYSFGGITGQSAVQDASAPNGLVLGSDGNFYGTGAGGGANGAGAVFRITSAGVETLLWSFGGYATGDGAVPVAGLIEGADGNFYGTTLAGGPYLTGSGTVFRLTPGGTESVLYAFTGNGGIAGSSDAALPQAALVQDSDGSFYGTTYGGGTFGAGTVFKVTPAGTESVLYSFGGDGADNGSGDGAYPTAALVQGSDGNFYGVTNAGGAYNQGSVFRVTPGGAATILHSFSGDGGVSGSADGAFPGSGLLIGNDGSLYGTTYLGGSQGDGTLYKLTAVVP